MSYIGIIGAGRIDKQIPSSGLIEEYNQAIELIRVGADIHSIKQKTGWEIGADHKWRYEIPDPFHTTDKIEDYIKRHFGEPMNIRYFMCDITLLIAYPAFERLRVFKTVRRLFQSQRICNDGLHGYYKSSFRVSNRRSYPA